MGEFYIKNGEISSVQMSKVFKKHHFSVMKNILNRKEFLEFKGDKVRIEENIPGIGVSSYFYTKAVAFLTLGQFKRYIMISRPSSFDGKNPIIRLKLIILEYNPKSFKEMFDWLIRIPEIKNEG